MAFILALLYLFVLLLQPHAWVKIVEGQPILEIILALACICLVPKMTDGTLSRLIRQPQTWCFGGFIIIAIISVFGEGIMDFGIKDLGYRYLKYFLAYLMIILAADSLYKIKICFTVLIITGCIFSIICLRFFYTGATVGVGVGENHLGLALNWRGSIKWFGVFNGSNGFGLLLVSILALSIGFLVQKESFSLRIFGLISGYIVGHAFYLTHSRGGFMGILAMSAAYLYIRTKINLKIFLPVILVMCVMILVLKPTQEGRGLGESSSNERVELYHQGLQMFKSNPILGVGAEQFHRNNPVHKVAHNIYVQQIAETGVFGILLFSMMYFFTIRTLIRFVKDKSDTSEEFKVGTTILVSFLSMIICLFFLTYNNEVPYIWLALCTAVPFSQGFDSHASRNDLKKLCIINAGVLFLVYFAIQLFFKLFG